MNKVTQENKSKYLTVATFEKGMDFMAKSFAKVFEKLDNHDKLFVKIFDELNSHNKVFDIMLREMKTYREESHNDRMTTSTLNSFDIKQEREIEGLKLRVEKLEQKVL
jgi:C-terminal processing protease CtpA/Prc